MLDNILVAIMCIIALGATAFGFRMEHGDGSGQDKKKPPERKGNPSD